MHELAITESLLSIILEKAREVKARQVTRVDLLVGRLTGYVPECIQLQFAILSHNTEAFGARLVFHQPPTKLHCRRCNLDYTSDSLDITCPQCRTLDIDILSGSELFIESIDVE